MTTRPTTARPSTTPPSPLSLRAGVLALVAGAATCSPPATLGPLGPAKAQAQDVQRRIERAIRSDALEEFRPKTDLNLSLMERTSLDVGGYAAFTGVWLNDGQDNSRRLAQPELALYARASIDGVHGFFGRARFTYRSFSAGDSFDGRGDRWTQPFADRYWYEFDLRRAVEVYQGQNIDGNINIRVGRQFVEWGGGLALSETLYSVRPTIEFSRRFKVEALAGITPDHTVDFDASRFTFDEKTRRGFFGARMVYTSESGTELSAGVLSMNDYYNDNRTRTTPVLDGVNFRTDSIYLTLGVRGALTDDLLLEAEGVRQFGDGWSDPFRVGFGTQTIEPIEAWAARGQLTYLFRDRGNSRAGAEFLYFSGDTDRSIATDTVGGNLTGTTDHGFNSLGFANVGLAFSPSLSNIMVLRAGASTFPLPGDETFGGLQIGVEGYGFAKAARRGPIDEATNNRVLLGSEIDAYLNWRLASDLTLTVRYGAFFPGPAIITGRQARHFVLVNLTLSF